MRLAYRLSRFPRRINDLRVKAAKLLGTEIDGAVSARAGYAFHGMLWLFRQREMFEMAAAKWLALRGGSALRGLIGLLLAACIFAAAFASQSCYGGAAKQIIA